MQEVKGPDSEFLPPQQERSRQTLDHLLGATIKLLEEEGLDKATIPRIAAVAGVAPASVYRRFKDKDALLRAAFLHVFKASGEAVAVQLVIQREKQVSFEKLGRAMVKALFRQYREHPKLIQSFVRFCDQQSNEAFRRESAQLMAHNILMLADALRSSQGFVSGPRSEFRTKFILLTIANAIESLVLEPDSVWVAVVDNSYEELEAEFTALLFAYLGTEG